MKPTIGRIVHFVQKKAPRYGDGLIHLPAIITAAWGETCVNLMVFSDGSNSEDGDGTNFRCTKWIPSVTLDGSDVPQERTWHWPERE